MNMNNKSEDKRIMDKWGRLFPEGMSWMEVAEKLDSMHDDPDVLELRRIACNTIIYVLSTGFRKYDHDALREWEPYAAFKRIVTKLPDSEYFYQMMNCLYKGDEKGFYAFFDRLVEVLTSRAELCEGDLVDNFVEPIKEGFPGFWKYAQSKLGKRCKKDGTHELCTLMAEFYTEDGEGAFLDTLCDFVRRYPNIIIAKEFLAMEYGNQKMWKNQIACLEGINDPMFYCNCMQEYYFSIGYAYGRTKDYASEEKMYRKALEIDPDTLHANNNLGWCLLRQSKFKEAESVLKYCIERSLDMPYAANNYAEALIRQGKNIEARRFVESGECKISKSIRNKVEKLPKANRIPKKQTWESKDSNTEQLQRVVSTGKMQQQFYSEKILEDDLTAKIEAGVPMFGKRLKVYSRKGEYGRQFIIPVGRLDLLCEDEEGNLYVIELKKDTGYGDAYEQTAKYLDWFAKSSKFKDKNVSGIICLNDPDKATRDKVKADERMRLFEYQTVYKEVS